MTEILEGSGSPFLEELRVELLSLAKAFSGDARPLGELLSAMVADVGRASAERLEIFPVCHHSPASALHLIERLRERPKPPRVIFMEMCEDLRGSIEDLRSCRLPVALQAFAPVGEAYPSAWFPLSVVAPITEFSAEYQAISYALGAPEAELVFVDRAVDHIFQWTPKEDDALEDMVPHDDQDDEPPGAEPAPKASHGSAIGIQVGAMEPTFEAFLEVLLKNARVRHFAEWWEQYVEQAVLGADYVTYRHVMFLVGSLLRRLGRREEDKTTDRLRERFMWTRMKQHLAAKGIAPEDAMYICGAAHSASDVEEFGTGTDKRWEIPPPTPTKWLYGIIPSSFAAIERQFSNPAGTVSMCESTWSKTLSAMSLTPYRLAKSATAAQPKKKAVKVVAAPPAPVEPGDAGLLRFLTRPPALSAVDQEELIRWSVDVVKLARDNGYLTSTADTIAVYQTSLLLANLRSRSHPSPYDFQDAAVTCLEKDRTPKKRNIKRICEILLGGDRVGMVGYASLPPLAQDVYDRLKPLGVNLTSHNIQRALIDFKQKPELFPCSDLLWRIHYLTPTLAKPTMGERTLGGVPVQESWDIYLGKYQQALIQLGYEGVSVESVIERRLKAKAFGAKATPVDALAAAEDSVRLLRSPRLTSEIGERAITLLRDETGAKDAPAVFQRVRRLVHYYRSTPQGLPEWLRRFVTTGYSHYATLLPVSFQDRGVRPEEVAGMLAFLFTLESLALSFGCQRSQLLIAVGQAAPVTDDPTKIGLLWSAEWLLGLRAVEQIREHLDGVLGNVLLLPSFPAYVSGFLLALGFTPLVGKLVVELLSKSFDRLPDDMLMPWLPSLIMALRPLGADIVETLVKEASSCFPGRMAALEGWTPPWETAREAPVQLPAAVELRPEEKGARALLEAFPAATNALAAALGEAAAAWSAGEAAAVPEAAPVQAGPAAGLLSAWPATMQAMAMISAARR